MLVKCKMNQCPYWDNEFCHNETLMINPAGACNDIARGFTPEQVNQIKSIIKPFNIEDVELNETKDETKENEVETKDNKEVNDGKGEENQEEYNQM